MREGIKEALAANPLAAPAHCPVQSANQLAPTMMRVIYPHQNDRYEIYASSEEELNQKDAAIRAAVGGGGR
jgi:hypothetical protein